MDFMNRITGLVLALVIGAILVGGLLIPSIEAMTATEQTFENEGIWRMTEIKNGMEWDYSDGTWELNNEVQVTNTGSNAYNNINAIAGEDWMARASGYLRGPTFTQSNYTGPIVVAANDQITITYGNNQTATVDLAGYGIDIAGEAILSDYDKAVYVKGDSTIYATGQSPIGAARGIIHFEGTIDDGITGTISKISGDNYTDMTLTDIVVDYEVVDGYKDLYKLNKITATASCVDSDSVTQTGTVTYSSYVVPYKVTAELTNHMTPTEIAMFGVISILGIVVLIVVAANGIRNKY